MGICSSAGSSFVVGHSWGSVLGLWLAHEHPDLIYANVGVGQVIDMEQNDALAYKDALQQAHALHNAQAEQALEAIAPFNPPPSLASKEGAIARHWEEQLLGPPARPGAFTDPHRLISGLLSDPSYSLADDYGFIRGLSLSMSTFAPQFSQVNLNQMGPDFQVPILFFEGARDPYCRPKRSSHRHHCAYHQQRDFARLAEFCSLQWRVRAVRES